MGQVRGRRTEVIQTDLHADMGKECAWCTLFSAMVKLSFLILYAGLFSSILSIHSLTLFVALQSSSL